MPQKSMKVSRAQLARLTGKTPQTVSQWITEGMPAIKAGTRGKRVEIDLAQALPWILDHRGTPPGSERERLAKEQADKHALDNAEKRRQLIRIEQVRQVLQHIVGSVTSNTRAMPSRLAGTLAGIRDPAKCRALLADESRRIQTALADDIAALDRPLR